MFITSSGGLTRGGLRDAWGLALTTALTGCSFIGGFTDERLAGDDATSASSAAGSTGVGGASTASTGGGATTAVTTASSSASGGDGGGGRGGGGAQGGASTTGSGGASTTGSGGAGGSQGSGGAPPEGGTWPDSLTATCSDGAVVGACSGLTPPLDTQDGAVLGATPRYVVSAGVVLDTITGLAWTQATLDDTTTWELAAAACDALDLDGGGWRLPNVRELTSLWNVGQIGGPRIDQATFPGTRQYYWTSTPTQVAGTNAVVRFSPGNHVLVDVSAITSASPRCVRGAPSVPTLRVTGETVVDLAAGLVWQHVPSATAMTWAEALAACSAAMTGGTGGWRLASEKELVTLIDPSRAPALPPELLNWQRPNYWTSSIDPLVPGNAAQFTALNSTEPLKSGPTSYAAMSTLRGAACVRDYP